MNNFCHHNVQNPSIYCVYCRVIGPLPVQRVSVCCSICDGSHHETNCNYSPAAAIYGSSNSQSNSRTARVCFEVNERLPVCSNGSRTVRVCVPSQPVYHPGGYLAHPIGVQIQGGYSDHPIGVPTRAVYVSPSPPQSQRVYVVGGYPLGSHPSIAYMGGNK